MENERVKSYTPEERERRIAAKRRKKRLNRRINAIIFSITAVCFIIFAITFINFLRYHFGNNAEAQIEKAKEDIKMSESQIEAITPEKNEITEAVNKLQAELDVYNGD